MTTIAKAGATVTALTVLGWDTTRPARTVVHAVIGKPEPDFTLRASGPRTGTVRYLFAELADAEACESLHGDAPAPVTLTDPATPGSPMVYLVTGAVHLTADDEAGTRWSVSVDFTEIT